MIELSPSMFAKDETPLYRQSAATVADRVADLLARMTLEEKLGQICAVWNDKRLMMDDATAFDPAKARENFPDGIGMISRPSDRGGPVSPRVVAGRGPAETVAFVNAAQAWALNETRLGIPILFHEEGLHGYAARDATCFPQAIALAGSFDTEMTREVAAATAAEIAARGVQQVLSPVVDVVRDPRWGRMEETFGEDPHLVSEMGVASVLGLQGETLPLAKDKVLATLKHLTGHGQPESGTNIGPAQISERALRENFFPPFATVIQRTKVAAVMPSYNEIDGVPSHVSDWLLQDILRGEMGFEGLVVSDYWALDDLERTHHVVPDLASAGARALEAGVDVDMPDGTAFRYLPELVRNGTVPIASVDRAVARVLATKFEAGLFDRSPFADAAMAEAATGNDAGRALALKAARRCVTLLQNDGQLPLNASILRRLAVVGPNAAAVRLGGYSGQPRRAVSVLEAIQTRVQGLFEVIHAEGCAITENDDWWEDEAVAADPDDNRRKIKEAALAARDADAIILCLGDTEQTSREAWAENHLGDRTSLDLPGEQNELAEAMFALGKPVIVVLLNGRSPSIVPIAQKASAILECWYLGQEGGTAIAEALFGDINPGAKLPVTLPRDVGQLPMFYNHKPSARRGWLFEDKTPLFPFGHGLSYTTFELSPPRLSAERIGLDGRVEVSVDVTNTGRRAGDEVVQLYVHDVVASLTRPVKELKGFKRVTLQPGETQSVRFELHAHRDLSFWDQRMQRIVEPGTFHIMTGPDSVQLQSVALDVTA